MVAYEARGSPEKVLEGGEDCRVQGYDLVGWGGCPCVKSPGWLRKWVPGTSGKWESSEWESQGKVAGGLVEVSGGGVQDHLCLLWSYLLPIL